MKKQSGIWLDLRNAYLVNLPEDGLSGHEPEVVHLLSGIEESAATGGSRSHSPWGPQGGDMQRSAQERRHHEEKDYFEAIIRALREHHVADLVVFGPSEAKHGLANAIREHKDLPARLAGVSNADQMSPEQMVAWVRDFFNRPAPRRLPRQ